MQDDEVLGKAYDARLMRRLLVYLRPYRASVALAFAAVALDVTAELSQPYLVKVAIDRYIAAGDLSALPRLGAIYFGLIAAVFVGEFLQTWTLQITGQNIVYDMREQIYDKLQRLDVRYYDRNPVGRLMTRVTSDVDALNE